MRKDFYLFFNIKGVLTNYLSDRDYYEMGFLSGEDIYLDKKNVKQLNALIELLEQGYNVYPVVIAKERKNMQAVVEGLYRAGFNGLRHVDRTKILDGQNTAQEVACYMKNHKIDNNYLIINNKQKAFQEVLGNPRIIKTKYSKGFTKDHIGHFVGTMRKEIKEELHKKIAQEHNFQLDN